MQNIEYFCYHQNQGKALDIGAKKFFKWTLFQKISILLKFLVGFIPYLFKKIPFFLTFKYYFTIRQKLNFAIWKRAHDIIHDIRSKRAVSIYSHKNIISEELQMGLEEFQIKNHYNLNCSGFVNHVLVSEGNFNALREIREYIFAENDRTCYRDTYYPRALTFVRFIKSKEERKYWKTVRNVNDIEPGDIIAYARNLNKITDSGQHMMIASNSMKREGNWTYVSVFDSTSGHGSNDFRGCYGGLEEGIIGIEKMEDGASKNLKWSTDSEPFDATIVIARVR